MNPRQQLTLILSCYLCLLSGCFSKPLNLNVTHMGPPYRITAYEHGQPVGQRTVQALSEDEMAIARWLEANRKGWKTAWGTTAPQRVVEGDGFTLNFTDTTCVLTIPPDPHAKGNARGKSKAPTEPLVLQRRLMPGDMELARILNGGP